MTDAPPLLRRPGAPTRTERDGIRIDDPRLAAVLAPESPLLELHAGGAHLEGPAWQPGHDRLIFSDVVNRRLLGWYPDGRVEVLIEGAWFPNGNAVAADGSVWHCEHGRRCISRSSPEVNGMPTPIVTEYHGRRLNSPNDVTIAADGAVWFTDPIFGIVMPSQGALADPALDHRSVYRFEPGAGALDRLADFAQPNGIGLSPDGGTLYVSDTSVSLAEVPGMSAGSERSIYALAVGTNGALHDRRHFATPDQGYPDGFAIDGRGWLWSSSANGIHVWDASGAPLGFVPMPCVVSNLCFGGAEGRRLFIAASSKLFALDLAA